MKQYIARLLKKNGIVYEQDEQEEIQVTPCSEPSFLLPDINQPQLDYKQYGVSVDSYRDPSFVNKYPKLKQKEI